MMRYILSFVLLFTSFELSNAAELAFPTFAEGLCRNGRSDSLYKKKFIKERDRAKLYTLKSQETLYRETYELGVSRILIREKNAPPKIPKVIHVIWLGSPFPEKYHEWQQSWKNMQGWEYRLWTDKDVANLDLINREIYNASSNFGEKSDILRYEILYQFGGLYVDTDFACFNPDYFEAFHHSLDLYVGVEPIEYQPLRVGNAIIGTAPQHPFLLKILTNLSKNCLAFKKYSPVERTGPGYMTKMMTEFLSDTNYNKETVTIFPSSFFYPFTKSDVTKKFNKGFSSLEAEDVMPETCAIHFWEGSWARNKTK